jgi:hypothetical protein
MYSTTTYTLTDDLAIQRVSSFGQPDGMGHVKIAADRYYFGSDCIDFTATPEALELLGGLLTTAAEQLREANREKQAAHYADLAAELEKDQAQKRAEDFRGGDAA